MYAFLALRFLCEGMEISRPVMYFGFIGLAVNVVANYGLIYGRWGLPALGAIGCGYATSAVWWTQFVGLIIYIRRHEPLATLHLRPLRLAELVRAAALLRSGLPIGFSFFVEVSMFAGVALLMGSIGAVAVAGHQIAINVASTTFMVPLGIALATTVRVGNALGRDDPEGARRAGWIGHPAGARGAGVVGLAAPDLSATDRSIYSPDPEVIAIACQLLAGRDLPALGRPTGRAAGCAARRQGHPGPMFITVVAYWLVGLPIGYWLCFHRDLGPQGLWIGIIGGLTVAGVLLVARFWQLSARLSVEVPPAA